MAMERMIVGAKETGHRVRHRLGIVGLPGFAPVPHMLMLHQKDLGLSNDDLVVFLNVFMHWQDAGSLPYPHTQTIARRMGVSQRKVQRHINALKKRGLLDVYRVRRRDKAQYDVRPLLKRLEPYAEKWAALNRRPPEDIRRSVEEMFGSLPGVV